MSQDPELSDQDEGVFATYEEQETRSDRRAAEQELSREEANEWGRAANARARALAEENMELRSRLGIEPGAELESVETGESDAGEGSRGNVGDEVPVRLQLPADVNDLVEEAPRASGISHEELRDLVREVVRELLPRPRAIPVYIENEGTARVDASEVVAKLFPSLVLVVAQLAGRATRVAEEDGLWSMGVSDEVAHQMNQVARAAPRRPKEVNRSRSF